MRDDSGSEPHTMGEGVFVRETDKALLIKINNRDIWIPKSCIHDDSELFDAVHKEGTVIVKRWWAAKNGHV